MAGHNTHRTLLLWLGWASAATVILFGLYLDTGVWEFIKNDPIKLSWVIVILFIIGVVINFILTAFITKESIETANLESLAKEQGLSGITPTSDKLAVNRFFMSLKKVTMANSPLDSEALLQLELARYQRTSHNVAVLGNLLITQGLIGTVVGLSVTLSGLSSSLDALGHDEALLLEGLRKAMSGMGTAFYATLLGAVCGGILLRVFALITEGGIEDLYDRIMKICLVYCAVDCKPTPEKDARSLVAEIDNLGRNVVALRAAFSESTLAIAAFREEVRGLASPAGDGDDIVSLKEAIRLQRHYRLLLKQEIKLLDQINRSWWPSLRKLFRK